jgi:hypothetical protein
VYFVFSEPWTSLLLHRGSICIPVSPRAIFHRNRNLEIYVNTMHALLPISLLRHRAARQRNKLEKRNSNCSEGIWAEEFFQSHRGRSKTFPLRKQGKCKNFMNRNMFFFHRYLSSAGRNFGKTNTLPRQAYNFPVGKFSAARHKLMAEERASVCICVRRALKFSQR